MLQTETHTHTHTQGHTYLDERFTLRLAQWLERPSLTGELSLTSARSVADV